MTIITVEDFVILALVRDCNMCIGGGGVTATTFGFDIGLILTLKAGSCIGDTVLICSVQIYVVLCLLCNVAAGALTAWRKLTAKQQQFEGISLILLHICRGFFNLIANCVQVR